MLSTGASTSRPCWRQRRRWAVVADDVAYYVSIVISSRSAQMAGGPMATRLGPVRLTQCGPSFGADAWRWRPGNWRWRSCRRSSSAGRRPADGRQFADPPHVTPARLANLTRLQSGVPLGFALAGALVPISVEPWLAGGGGRRCRILATALLLKPGPSTMPPARRAAAFLTLR
jgi:hypothetical protein